MILGFGNNLVSSLASDITASQTAISVMPGDGPLFSTLLTSDFSNKSTTLKNYAKITLTDAGETAFEICHLISVSGDTLTVIRGQEGTAAKGWSLKDVIANFATRGSENIFPQIAHIQSGFYTSGIAGGTANALTLELPSTFFLNGSVDWVLKTPLVVYPSQNNTAAATLQLTMGGKVLGTFPLYKGNKAQLSANDILKDVGLVCLLDNTKTFFNVANPGAIYAGLGTAAFKDIVTSMTDATAGRIPVVGWMGIGGPEINIADGTDIYKYFPTAKSGNYGGGGALVNTATSGGWHGFKWQQHGGDSKYGFLIETVGNSRMALHIYNNPTGDMTNPQNYWTNSGLMYSTGFKPTAADVGALPIIGGTMTGVITTSSTGKGSFASQLTNKAPVYQEVNTTGTSEYWPLIKQKYVQGNSAWSIGMLINTGELRIYYSASTGTNDKNFGFRPDGQFIPPNYANFDARYQVKGSYGKPNTASKAANGWWQCGDTGIIEQWIQGGTVTSETTQTITFPKAFPTACALVEVGTLNANNSSGSEGMFQLVSKTTTSCVVRCNRAYGDVGSVAVLIRAVGY